MPFTGNALPGQDFIKQVSNRMKHCARTVPFTASASRPSCLPHAAWLSSISRRLRQGPR